MCHAAAESKSPARMFVDLYIKTFNFRVDENYQSVTHCMQYCVALIG